VRGPNLPPFGRRGPCLDGPYPRRRGLKHRGVDDTCAALEARSLRRPAAQIPTAVSDREEEVAGALTRVRDEAPACNRGFAQVC
jgi:hypothetical protein